VRRVENSGAAHGAPADGDEESVVRWLESVEQNDGSWSSAE
jgi:hypothetical protein